MTKGDIVLVKFPFTDLSGNKLRPAIVLISGRSEITVAFVTTNFKNIEKNDLVLTPNSINGLKKDSLLKLNKIATLDLDLVEGKIGNLNESELREVDKKIIDVFKIKIL
ncbi:MAG: type II toxin-antitoxin system PemK/MazF family toxin [Nitrospinota bacterium]